MVKKVLLEATWLTVSSLNHLLVAPPDGYQFVQAGDIRASEQRFFKAVSSLKPVRDAFLLVDGLVPMTLLRSSLLQRWARLPQDVALTYAIHHLVFRRQPWVIEAEAPLFLVGNRVRHLRHYKRTIERTLASPYCRRILCWSQATHRAFLSQLDCRAFRDKFELVHLAVPPKSDLPPKDYSSPRPLKLLFLGSMRTLDPVNQFFVKGGREVVAAFQRLQPKYPEMQLVLRSGLSRRLKAQYRCIPNLKIVDYYVPRAELEHEFLTSDVFLAPSYNTTPQSLLDAMSYEMAVISLDNWANAEYVSDGETGLMVTPSRRVPWELCGSAEYREAMRRPQAEVVEQIVEKVSRLAENPALRRKLAQAGRREAEAGRFSIAARNAKLKRVFDEATTDG